MEDNKIFYKVKEEIQKLQDEYILSDEMYKEVLKECLKEV